MKNQLSYIRIIKLRNHSPGLRKFQYLIDGLNDPFNKINCIKRRIFGNKITYRFKIGL